MDYEEFTNMPFHDNFGPITYYSKKSPGKIFLVPQAASVIKECLAGKYDIK